MHLNRGADDSVQLLSFVQFVSSGGFSVSIGSVFGLNRVYLTLDYEIVLQLLLPES